MTIPYYVATKSDNIDIFKRINTILRSREDANFVLAVDWTTHPYCKPFSIHRRECKHQAIVDVAGIRNSMVFILAYDGSKGSGMFFELGYAYSLLTDRFGNHIKHITVVYDEEKYHISEIIDQSMFMALPELEFVSLQHLHTHDFDKIVRI